MAQTGAPYFTEDYQNDERFLHRDFIDSAVAGENIRAILGVPLVVEGTVIGALLAVHRTVRPFPAGEVSLLMSFAAHAAIALENARLFERIDRANQQVQRAGRRGLGRRRRPRPADRRAAARRRGVATSPACWPSVLRGSVVRVRPRRAAAARVPTTSPTGCPPRSRRRSPRRGRRAAASPSTLRRDGPSYVAVALAGTEHLGTLLLRGDDELGLADRRTLERGALVTALVLLFRRSVAQAEERVRGELLADLLDGREVDEHRLGERARRQHADLDRPSVVAVAEVVGLERHRAAQVAARLAGESGGLAGEYDGRVVMVAPTDDPLALARVLHERMRAAGGDATVGAAAAPPGASGVAATYPEARRCLDTLITLGRAGEVSDPAGLGLARLLLGQNGPAELDAFIERMVGPVLAYDAKRGTELVATLEAWYASGARPAETAKRLHVHPNTVAQRLDRVATLLGKDWRAPARGLDLQLALRLVRLVRLRA